MASETPIFASAENTSGRTFIITGANIGFGFLASKHLVAAGAARVILAVRNLVAGEEAKAKIEAATGRTGVAEVWELDLANYASVKAFAKKAETDLDRIDAVVMNAAVMPPGKTLAEGHSLIVTVNVLSTFLLTFMLLPQLSASATKFNSLPHLAVVASTYGFQKELWDTAKKSPIARLDDEENMDKAYALTKLVDTLVTLRLASLVPLDRTGVVINALCPGFAATGLYRSLTPAAAAYISQGIEHSGITVEEGSHRLLHGALAGKESHGRFLENCQIADDRIPDWVANDDGQTSAELTWNNVITELEKIEPGLVQRVLELGK